jgi:tetratricopeptide (TPR) repeat protein
LRRRGTLGSRLLLLVAVVACPGVVRAASYWDLFEQGKAAVEQGRHAEGKQLLLKALQERPEEGRHKIGTKFYDYYPSHYLAAAALGQGNVGEAERFLAGAEAVEKKTQDETRLLQELRQRLEAAKGAKPPDTGGEVRPPPPPTPPVTTAPPAVRAAVALANKALENGDMAEARREAARALQLDPGNGQAKGILDAVRDYVAGKVTAAREELQDGELAAAETRLADLARIDADAPGVKTLQAEVQSRRQAGAKAMAEAEIAASAGRVAEAQEKLREALAADRSLRARAQSLETRLASRDGRTPPPPRTETGTGGGPGTTPPVTPRTEPRDDAVAGMQSFFRGEVPACIATLEAVVAKQPQRLDVLAVLASAHATRAYLSGGEAQDADMRRARELFGIALAQRKDLQLDGRYYSPRVRALLDQVRASR